MTLSKTQRYALAWTALALLCLGLVWLLSPVLAPFLTAGILAYALSPAVEALTRRRVPRLLAVVLVAFGWSRSPFGVTDGWIWTQFMAVAVFSSGLGGYFWNIGASRLGVASARSASGKTYWAMAIGAPEEKPKPAKKPARVAGQKAASHAAKRETPSAPAVKRDCTIRMLGMCI